MNTAENRRSATGPTSDSAWATIHQALTTVLEPEALAELRIIGPGDVTSGYYDDLKAMARDAAAASGHAEGVYMTLNPVRADLLERSPNTIRRKARPLTGDRDILRRRWLLVDLDPKRPSGVSSTDAEHAAALARAREIRGALQAEGWPDPILADSGNGAHLLYRVDLPNDSSVTTLMRRALQALDLRFTDVAVSVDLTTFNASRLVKVYGTLAAKGPNTAERPHRVSALVEVPSC